MTERLATLKEQQQPDPAKPSLASWAVLIAFLPFLVEAVFYLKILIRSVFIHNDVCFPEGASVYAFLTAFHTGKLYTLPFESPWNVQLYGPLLYYVGSWCAAIAHGDPHRTAELVRALSFTAFAGSVAIVAYLSWKLERVKRWAVLTAILGFACTWAVPYAATARADALSIFLILAALAVFVQAEGRSRWLFAAGVLGTLSIFTKQTTVAVLVALVLDRIIARKFKQTAIFISGGIAVAVVILGALWFRHEAFLANIAAVGHTIRSWHAAVKSSIDYVRVSQASMIPIAVALIGLGASWRNPKYRAIVLAVILGCASNLAALANTGGADNYLILPWLLLMLLVPAGLREVECWTSKSTGRLWIPASLLLIGAALLAHQRNLLARDPQPDLDASHLKSVTMLSDMPYLEMQSRDPQVMDAFFYTMMAKEKLWSNAPILARIDAENYDLILIGGIDGKAPSDFDVKSFRGTSNWGADSLAAMNAHYRVLCEVPGHLVLTPKERTGTLTTQDAGRIFRHACVASDRLPRVEAGAS
jgi:hypothetical protein